MNCKNCNCPSCVNDRSRTDLKAHRLLTINRSGLHLVKQPIVTLPDGCRILAFWIVNGGGNRVGKISGDMNVETENEIRAKYVG